jgi:hypothetical protein
VLRRILDQDVAILLKKFSQESGLTFRDAVNQSIRRGLVQQEPPQRESIPAPRAMGQPLQDLTQSLSLVESLQDSQIVESFGS